MAAIRLDKVTTDGLRSPIKMAYLPPKCTEFVFTLPTACRASVNESFMLEDMMFPSDTRDVAGGR